MSFKIRLCIISCEVNVIEEPFQPFIKKIVVQIFTVFYLFMLQ